MSVKLEVAVLGLGRFGRAVAEELTQLGHDVLAIDANEPSVHAVVHLVAHAVEADVTSRKALDELGLGRFDVGIVAIGEPLESSILATALLHDLGVPRILARGVNDLHGSILERVGAHRVVYPEREAGLRMARSLLAFEARDYLNLAPGSGFARVRVAVAWAGKTLGEVDLPGTFGLVPSALCRDGSVSIPPDPSDKLHLGDELIIGGRDELLERLLLVDPQT